ncbi:hypothetical protein BN77_2005 [Rhizobium mesoamericanum STM3625]|uniref:Uncharacterized protein n=1 Tax=Rhizobium mesoamericanum STM3625 TaxID=1211777 RepID=K0PTZ9_9HYPH|nr:hypothetical protein BN77_2005 [Rhizobium mesoamericanum STM3625]
MNKDISPLPARGWQTPSGHESRAWSHNFTGIARDRN